MVFCKINCRNSNNNSWCVNFFCTVILAILRKVRIIAMFSVFHANTALAKSSDRVGSEHSNQIPYENLMKQSTVQLEQIFKAATAGSLPQGLHKLRILDPDRGLGSTSKMFGELLWTGRFYEGISGVMVNRTVTGDRFPAKIFCMTGPTDYQRNSIVIDYQHAKSIKGYIEKLDWVAGPLGLDLTEELRMIQPGLYLGKAWSNKSFLHYFISISIPGNEIRTPVNCDL